MSYHFPIILNQDEAERIVMVHLLGNTIDTGHDYYIDDFENETANDEINQKEVTVNENNHVDDDNQTDSSINRVVITTTSPSMPLFRIPKNVRLINPQGDYLDSRSVEFEALHKIARIRAEYKRDLDQLKRKQSDLKKRQPLSPSQAKKYDELEKAIQIKSEEKQKIDQEVVDITNDLQGKKVFKIEYNNRVIEQKSDDPDYYEYYVRKGGVFDDDIIFTLMLDYGHDDALEYSGGIRIVRPMEDNEVTIINVDLGSDATQVGYYDGNAHGSQNVYILEAMKASYANQRQYVLLESPGEEPLFTQEEKGNPEFYKTGNITFHKYEKKKRTDKSGKETIEEACGCLEDDITSSDTFINYLNVSAPGKNRNETLGSKTWEFEKGFSKKLINLKMLYSYPRRVGRYVQDVKYCFRSNSSAIPQLDKKYLAPVMRTIYKQIISVSINQINKDNCKYYSVLLLVPNIYTQHAIELLLYEMNKLNDLTKNVRYDFRAISESDAAFVGLRKKLANDGAGTALDNIIKKPSSDGDNVLIIDAGKGTTDYSIIHYNPSEEANNSSVPLRRNGIVGAGGAIDYVFARSFARQVYAHLKELGIDSVDVHVDKEEFIRRFMTLIQRLPQVDQDRVMLMVELMKKEYKKSRSGNGYTTAKVYTCFMKEMGDQGNGTDAQKIIEQLVDSDVDYGRLVGDAFTTGWKIVSNWTWNNETVATSDEDNNEVEWVCKAIAESVVNDIQRNTSEEEILKSIGYVILTGRSFKFDPLKSAFEKKIQTLSNSLSSKRSVLKPSSWRKFPLEKVKIKNPNCDMKTVSVYFLTHNLGMNCNSDLCCMQGLSVIRENGDACVRRHHFWEGFVGTNDETYYYLGYYRKAFTRDLLQFVDHDIQDAMEDLINMTLFPVAYVEVKCGGSTSNLGNQGIAGTNTTLTQKDDNPIDDPIEEFAKSN